MKKIFACTALFIFVLACETGQQETDTTSSVPETVTDVPGDTVVLADLVPVVDVLIDFIDTGSIPDTSGELPSLECQPGEGCFLDKCESNDQCQSGWCVEHMGENVCSQNCAEECPPGWTCKQVGASDPDLIYVCVSNYSNLCKPCVHTTECKAVGGAEDVCLDYGDEGSFCGGSCTEKTDCPWGFSCQESLTVNGVSTMQCVADAGVCPCTGTSVQLGLWTACLVENDFGSCTGQRLCTAEGLSDCDASVPAAESCNGIDDDCDTETDEPDLLEGIYQPLCDDDNDCTEDKCAGTDGCLNEILESGSCDDDNPCTVADHCASGMCLGNLVECDDKNSCTDDSCDGTGGCLFTNNTADCDDQNPCTIADDCNAGECTGTSIPCDCQKDEDCTELEDDNLCNGTLYCDVTALPYQCKVAPQTVVDCPNPDGNEAICLAPLCTPATGECSFVPDHDGYLCDDADPCTVDSKCVEGVCSSGQAVNCNDGNLCTDDECAPGSGCISTPNSAACGNGNACTINDYCADGTCQNGDPLVCSDENTCDGEESCDPAVGCIAGQPLVCDDLDACNGIESCDPSSGCQTGIPLNCDDSNPCTDDSCNPLSGCTYTFNSAACTDNNACTTGDICAEGSCSTTGIVDCADANPCTDDACHNLSGCIYTMNQASCDDDDLCTTGDHCHLGECIGADSLPCADNNPCTDDSCEKALGCTFIDNQAECDDGNLCTKEDACKQGWCSGASVNCDDSNPCTTDSCSPDSGCLHDNNDLSCNDGDACTTDDKCASGQCVGGPPLNCSDSNPCTDETCLPESGCQLIPNSAPCQDGDACTKNDTCSNSECQAGPTIACDDLNPCTDDTCTAEDGCLHLANNTQCDDGNACTDGDQCAAGKCQPGGATNCDDGNVCTDDSCDPVDGCLHQDNDDGCDDDSQCTLVDVCVQGACIGSGDLACSDGNPCTDDTCEPAKGCVFVPNTSDCNDGDGCTLQDTCNLGQCMGTACSDLGLFCVGGTCKDTPCSGVDFGGYCWQSGSVNSSCSSICSGHGGCVAQGLHDFSGATGCQVCQYINPGKPCQQHGDCNCAAVYPGLYTSGSSWCGYNSSDCTTCSTAKSCGSYSVIRYCPCTN
jgi:hypothetical protein